MSMSGERAFQVDKQKHVRVLKKCLVCSRQGVQLRLAVSEERQEVREVKRIGA